MSNPPKDQSEFWIRFVCAALFFGLIMGIWVLRSVDSWGIPMSVAIWATSTLAISLYAAMTGDEAWEKLLNLWWW